MARKNLALPFAHMAGNTQLPAIAQYEQVVIRLRYEWMCDVLAYEPDHVDTPPIRELERKLLSIRKLSGL